MRKLLGALGGGGKGSDGKGAKKKVIRANLGDENSFYYDEKVRGTVARIMTSLGRRAAKAAAIFFAKKKKKKLREKIMNV